MHESKRIMHLQLDNIIDNKLHCNKCNGITYNRFFNWYECTTGHKYRELVLTCVWCKKDHIIRDTI